MNNRMARGTRRGTRVFSTLFSPISHLLRAGKKSVGAVTNAAKGIVGKGLNGANRVGRSITGEMNATVTGLGKGLTRKTRRGGKRNTRRGCRRGGKRNTRRNRRS